MSLWVLGLNHQTAPVELRERVSFAGEALPAALASLRAHPQVEEAVLLSTCNRTELYAVTDDPDSLNHWLNEQAGNLDGHLYQLVADSRRAWHAGPGRWGPLGDLNSTSIGIEIDNDGDSPFPPAQIQALIVLLEDLSTRLNIPRHAVIAHADMAPTRKRDPGALFPWAQLAHAGYGLWPDPADGEPPAGFDPWLALQAIGYPLDDPAATVRAYRRHFRGDEAGELDAQDHRILHSLVLQARRLR